MFEDESPGPVGGSEEDQRALREDNRESHEVMVAQREGRGREEEQASKRGTGWTWKRERRAG